MQSRVIDLFCGCGGLSLGATWAGMSPTLAIDVDATLTSSFAINHQGVPLLLADIANLSGAQLIELAGPHVDGIIGGPPCQAFSEIGRRRPEDERRSLLKHFFRIVRDVKPRFFVMENVRGLLYRQSIDTLLDAMRLVEKDYTIWGPEVVDSAEFGAATRRPRVFVIGIRNDEGVSFETSMLNPFRRSASTVREAIGDLADAEFSSYDDGYDIWRLITPAASSYAAELRNSDELVTGHLKTAHKAHVVQRFMSVTPGEVDPIGRHPKLHWEKQCPTLRAGTGADRGSFQAVRPLHPEIPRVITVREAARLQGFPDNFRFHKTVWHSFRMIGNSVSPILASAIFSAVMACISGESATALNETFAQTAELATSP